MYSKPQMLTHLEYSSTSHNSQPTPIGIRDPVHCATYTRPCFPLRSRPIPYNSYRCPLVYSSDMPWTSRIVIPEMTWWSDILASLLLSSAWDPNHQLLPDPWWRNIVFEFFCLFLFNLSLFIYISMAPGLSWYIMFLPMSYTCTSMKYLVPSIFSFESSDPISLASVEIFVFSFCFSDILSTNPRPT